MSANQERLRVYGRTLKTQATILGSLVALAWFIELLDWAFFRGALDSLGIIPRTLIGLRGIVFAPLLHANFAHLAANTVPFLLLGWLVMAQRRGLFAAVSLVVALIAGVGTWLFGQGHTVHIGASGLVFGYFGFLLLWAYYRRSLGTILLAALLLLFYGSLLWGILPQGNGISWQGHLFGLIGGGVAAYLFSEEWIVESG
jgi:membrane associated rhomboid family serine protease